MNPQTPRLGSTEYYKTASGQLQAGAYGGNAMPGATILDKAGYVSGLQDKINTANQFFQDYSPTSWGGYVNKQNGSNYVGENYDPNTVKSWQDEIGQVNAGSGKYADNYIDPSFSQFQANAPTPSNQYLTPEAQAKADQTNALYQKQVQASGTMGPSNPAMNSVMASSSTTSPAGSLPSLNNSNPQPYPTTGTPTSPVTPTATGSAYPTQNLQPGMTGDAVKQLQQYLVSKGLMTQDQMNTGAGIYGPQTTAAVAALQKQLGIDTQGNSGYFGPLTQSALGKSPAGGSGTPVSNTTGTSGTPVNTGATGTSASTPSGTFGPGNMTLTQAFQDYKNAQQFSPQYLADQSALMNLTGGTTVFNANAESQPISNTFISGQEAQQLKNVNAAAVPLQTRLAIDQAQRQAAIDTANTEMGLTSTAVPYGGSNTNLLTGQTNSSGLFGTTGTGSGINPATGLSPNSSTSEQLGYLSGAGINVDKNNAPFYLAALQSGKTAQDIINSQANVAGTKSAATTGNAAYTDPLTGQRNFPTTTVGSGSSSLNNNGSINSAPTPTANSYTVQSGDIFHQIALNNGMTTAQLQALNPQITDPSKITPGQKINLAPAGSNPQASSPNTLPTPTSYAQKSFAQDFTSGKLADTINAQNTAVGHLTAAFDLAQQMENFALQPANAGKNFLATATGKAAVDNYNLAHTLSSSELSSAYGNDTGGERSLTAALGSSNSSPEQLKGFVQTSAALLSSKILSNVQQYKTAYGQNAPINLNWFVSPQNQQALAKVGIIMKTSGNDVGAYQVQPDGSAKKI